MGRDVFEVAMGSQTIALPKVTVNDALGIALLMTIDTDLEVIAEAGAELAGRLAPAETDVIATAATLGIPVAMAVAGALGHRQIVVLQKTDKIHLADALVEPLSSITTDGEQVLRLDRARLPLVAGKRVAFVDDVISTGGSVAAALRLLRAGGGDVVAIGALLAEGTGWRSRLGADADLVTALGAIPVFRIGADGVWTEDWE